MILFFFLMPLPSIASIILYYGLRHVNPLKLKIAIPVTLFAAILTLWLLILPNFESPVIVPEITWFLVTVMAILIASAVACPVFISMSIFSNIFSKKGEAIAAFLAPFLSIPFIFALMLAEMRPEQPLPSDFFWHLLPICGWAIDLITFNLKYVLTENSILTGFLIYFGFFVEILILMLFLFGWLKCVSIADKRREQKRNDEK